jgi:hypothetical protein
MTDKEIKYNLNKVVIFHDPKDHTENQYILRAGTIRMDERGNFFYQAELQDINAPHSVRIVRLDDIEVIPYERKPVQACTAC